MRVCVGTCVWVCMCVLRAEVTQSSSFWLGWLLSLQGISGLCFLRAEITVSYPIWLLSLVLGIELRPPSHSCGTHSTDFPIFLASKLYFFEVNEVSLFHHWL